MTDRSTEIKTLEEIRRAEEEVEWLLTAARSEAAAVIEAARAEAAAIISGRGGGIEEIKKKMQAQTDATIETSVDELMLKAEEEAERILTLTRDKIDSWAAELATLVLPRCER